MPDGVSEPKVHAEGIPLHLGTTQHFYEPPSHVTQAQAASSPLPTWSSSFTYNGTTYPYTMIGTDPANGSATTTIPVTIIPLKVVFSNGAVFNGSKKVTRTVDSPIFQSAQFKSGDTQFADAMQRAEFWKTVSTISPNYHVLLGTPTVAPVTTIKVPTADGTSGSAGGAIYFSWFDSQLQGLLSSDNIAPNMLPIFLTDNILTYNNIDQTGCCQEGYHEVRNANLQTFIWASNLSAGLYPGTQDNEDLSHEIAEWMNDPFVNNTVPGWQLPSEPYYGCSTLLEVGDPLDGNVEYTVKIGTTAYYVQDIAFFSWFARESPSQGIKGQYTYRNSFSSYSPPCS